MANLFGFVSRLPGNAIFDTLFKAVLRIRDVYPGSEFFPSWIPNPNFFHTGSRIRIKEFN